MGFAMPCNILPDAHTVDDPNNNRIGILVQYVSSESTI